MYLHAWDEGCDGCRLERPKDAAGHTTSGVRADRQPRVENASPAEISSTAAAPAPPFPQPPSLSLSACCKEPEA